MKNGHESAVEVVGLFFFLGKVQGDIQRLLVRMVSRVKKTNMQVEELVTKSSIVKGRAHGIEDIVCEMSLIV
jgi:hypothetical protein